MVDPIDLLIAVIGIMVCVVGSSTALWLALAKKPDKEDLSPVGGKLDALTMRFVPDHLPQPGQ